MHSYQLIFTDDLYIHVTGTRVYFMIGFSFERGGMCNLAYIGATVLNFGPAWPADVCAAKT